MGGAFQFGRHGARIARRDYFSIACPAMHNRASMVHVRLSRFIAAGALAWAACSAAQTGDSVGTPALRLSTMLSRVPAETAETESAREPGTPGFTERTQQPVELLQRTREQRERDLLEALSKARGQQEATAGIERRLAEVRNQRYANPVVYTLAALLAIAVAGAAFFWLRTRPRRQEPAGERLPQDAPELA
jgi:hypothetical protein